MNMVFFGSSVDGAYAEYVLSPAYAAIPLPPEIPLVEGSIIADATTTPFHAVVNRGQVKPGDAVVVFGCGGIGLNCVQVAAAVGAQVIAVDIADHKLEWARKLGAKAAVNPKSVERLDKELRKLTGGGADVAFECIGNPATQEQGGHDPGSGPSGLGVGDAGRRLRRLGRGRALCRSIPACAGEPPPASRDE